MTKVYREGDWLISHIGSRIRYLPFKKLEMIDHGDGTVSMILDPNNIGIKTERYTISDIVDINGNSYGELIQSLALGLSKGIDVNVQDQATRTIINPFSQLQHQTTLTVEAAKDDRTVTVDSTGSIAVGDLITLFSPLDKRFMASNCLSFTATTITIDMPVDFEYPIGAYVDIGDTNLAVDGSVTPQIFGLRNDQGTPPEGLDVTGDITTFIFQCETVNAVDLSTFGDIAGGLTNGLVMRRVDGIYQNIFNVHNNGDIAGIMFDWTPYSAQNVNQGQNGFIARLTLGGQSQMGGVQRIKLGEDLQIIVQDALQTITRLIVTAEGHLTQN